MPNSKRSGNAEVSSLTSRHLCLMKAWAAHESEIHRWLERRLPSAADAEDMVQDLFLKGLRMKGQFCDVRNARAWLYEVARNALADRLRCARTLIDLPADLVATAAEEPTTLYDLTACLPRVLAELSVDDREAITLCDLQDLPHADYARLKGLSLAGAKSRVQRARRRLKAQLAEACKVQLDERGRVRDFTPRPSNR